MKFLILALSIAHADMFSDARKPAAPTACAQIEAACTKAGFSRKSPKGPKDLDDECFAPTLNGTPVPNVNIPRNISEECLGSMPKLGVPTKKSH